MDLLFPSCPASVQEMIPMMSKHSYKYQNAVTTESVTRGDYSVCFALHLIDAFTLLTKRFLFVVEDVVYMYGKRCCTTRDKTYSPCDVS